MLLTGEPVAVRPASLVDQARRVAALVERVSDANLDGLCEACGAAEQLVGQLEGAIRRLVDREDLLPSQATALRVR